MAAMGIVAPTLQAAAFMTRASNRVLKRASRPRLQAVKSAEHALCPGLHSYVRGRAGETASKHFRPGDQAVVSFGVTVHVFNEGLKMSSREHPAPGCAWSWAPGGMIGPMGGLHSHVVSLTRLHVLQIHRVGKVGHCRTVTQPGRRDTTTSNTVHCDPQAVSSSQCLLYELGRLARCLRGSNTG